MKRAARATLSDLAIPLETRPTPSQATAGFSVMIAFHR